MKLPHARHLSNEEVDYELRLRNKEDETRLNVQSKREILRKLFQVDRNEKLSYTEPPYDFEEEMHFVKSKVEGLLLIAKTKIESETRSKLIHYYYRVHRALTTTEEAKNLRAKLLGPLTDILKAQAQAGNLTQSENEGDPKPELTQDEKDEKEVGGSGTNKGGKGGSETQEPTKEELWTTITRLQEEITALRLANQKKNQRSSDSDSSDSVQFDPPPPPPPAPRPRPRERHDSHCSYSGEYARDRYRNRNQRRIEHWRISFSGDQKATSVEDFLFRLQQIAKRENVSQQQLLRDVHLVLEGQASDWFFTYVDELRTWEEFEKRIRDRFGNPNRDQGIRQKIHDRKQQRDELFAAFVTEIERLNKMLSKPLSSRRKYEVIWDNMRPFYRSRIATIEVKNLDHLMKLARGIDAADFRQPQTDAKKPSQVHNIDFGEDETLLYDTEDIDAIQPHTGASKAHAQGDANKNRQQPSGSSAFKHPVGNQHKQPANQTTQQTPKQVDPNHKNICWNCRKTGHNWRICTVTPKAIFCYGCGELGRTIRTCPKCGAAQASNNQSSNQGNQ